MTGFTFGDIWRFPAAQIYTANFIAAAAVVVAAAAAAAACMRYFVQ